MRSPLNKVSLLGCGWLGHSLGESLISKGFLVQGSTTQRSKEDLISSAGIRPFLIHFGCDDGALERFLETDILVLNLPPSLKGHGRLYLETLKRVVELVFQKKSLKVIFVGSTGVYGENQGVVDEFSRPLPSSKRGENLLAAEKIIRELGDKVTIVRFGGLVGGNRHPAFSLSGRMERKVEKGPINLIHKEDCVGIILSLIEHSIWGNYSMLFLLPPGKEEYYNSVCDHFPSPIHFIEGVEGKG